MLSFLLLVAAVVLLGLVEVTTLGTGAVWLAVALAVVAGVLNVADRDRNLRR